MEKIKVILVDDHAVVRAGYKILLSNIEKQRHILKIRS